MAQAEHYIHMNSQLFVVISYMYTAGKFLKRFRGKLNKPTTAANQFQNMALRRVGMDWAKLAFGQPWQYKD